jgi:hypothetical protein
MMAFCLQNIGALVWGPDSQWLSCSLTGLFLSENGALGNMRHECFKTFELTSQVRASIKHFASLFSHSWTDFFLVGNTEFVSHYNTE